tara:strand:- start:232 stop:468 length:237 start_codon:yes stop_codon:yes gene_type:complete
MVYMMKKEKKSVKFDFDETSLITEAVEKYRLMLILTNNDQHKIQKINQIVDRLSQVKKETKEIIYDETKKTNCLNYED